MNDPHTLYSVGEPMDIESYYPGDDGYITVYPVEKGTRRGPVGNRYYSYGSPESVHSTYREAAREAARLNRTV